MIAFFLLLKLFVIILAEDQNIAPEPSKHLYYGQHARIEDYPYFAGLNLCGAVILSENWVLTAAHCVADKCLIGSKNVWVGGSTRNDGIIVSYDDIIVHQEYSTLCEKSVINDIALLKLTTPLEFSSKIQPVKLPIDMPTSPNLVVVGRGLDESNNDSEYLKKIDLVQLPTRECIFSATSTNYHLFVKENLGLFERSHICARREVDLPSVCYGDSGGPVVSKGTLVGLVSYGENGDCQINRISLYTNVATYVPWIKQHTGL